VVKKSVTWKAFEIVLEFSFELLFILLLAASSKIVLFCYCIVTEVSDTGQVGLVVTFFGSYSGGAWLEHQLF
jgi:hypothetical protein